MNANVYQHFRKDEHSFIDIATDWIAQVEGQYAPYLTNFLDPRQAYILETLIRQQSELKFTFYGGYEAAERKRCFIYPEYYQPTLDDFDITIWEIVYPHKFTTLSHGKILGTLVNAGIKRDYFGDIISDGEKWQVFIAKEVGSFIQTQIDKIGKINVRLEARTYLDILRPKDDWQEERTTISSLRLDNLIASVYNISRQRAKQLIENGKVKINWAEMLRPDFAVDLLDVVSIRGFGRIQIQAIEGKTKKDKFRLLLGVLRK